MAILKQITRALFKQQKEELGTKCRSPVIKPAIVSRHDPNQGKPKPREKVPLVATDGHRLHITPAGRMAHKPKYTGRDIMLQLSVSKIARVLSGNFQILQDRHVIFQVDMPGCEAEAGYKLIDDNFRNYERVMVKRFSGSCKAGKMDISKVLNLNIWH